jgi:hypothetical protein
MKTCKSCKYYEDETHTPTGEGIAYCYEKESRRYGMQTGSIQTVVYADGNCRYWKEKNETRQCKSPLSL